MKANSCRIFDTKKNKKKTRISIVLDMIDLGSHVEWPLNFLHLFQFHYWALNCFKSILNTQFQFQIIFSIHQRRQAKYHFSLMNEVTGGRKNWQWIIISVTFLTCFKKKYNE